jgi:hypothetical protein
MEGIALKSAVFFNRYNEPKKWLISKEKFEAD